MTLKKIALRILLVGLAAVALAAALFFPSWKQASYNGGQQYAEPFRIAGNLYFVGANDVAAFLITGPDGHILIDGGYPGTARMIMASIAELGFDIRDVKVLLNSHAHFDHAGGLKELQDASGAALWISEPEADIIAEGGSDDPFLGPLGIILPILEYPAPRVDHRFKDGAKIRVGGTELTGYITAGHSPGCTSWSLALREGDRELLAVSVCSLGVPPTLSFGDYPEIRAAFERSFRTLRDLPADIWVTAHGRDFGRWRKFSEGRKAGDPVAPFIDPEGYRRYIDDAEATYRKTIADH